MDANLKVENVTIDGVSYVKMTWDVGRSQKLFTEAEWAARGGVMTPSVPTEKLPEPYRCKKCDFQTKDLKKFKAHNLTAHKGK